MGMPTVAPGDCHFVPGGKAGVLPGVGLTSDGTVLLTGGGPGRGPDSFPGHLRRETSS